MDSNFGDVAVSLRGHVATVEICRPPHNFFDVALIRDLAKAFQHLDRSPACRASVLATQGSAFCAGANFSSGPSVLDKDDPNTNNPLYDAAVELFACEKPIIAAVHGTTAGGTVGAGRCPDSARASARRSASVSWRNRRKCPLAVTATRKTLRRGLAEQVKLHSAREDKEQAWLAETEDVKEGVKAVADRRRGTFSGK